MIEKFIRLYRELVNRMEDFDNRLKRLESGGGSGATTCYAGREADGEQGGVDEERSDREDRRVTPEEARQALIKLRDEWISLATHFHDLADQAEGSEIRTSIAYSRSEVAEAYGKAASMLTNAACLPKPESGAVEDERSGRRNAQCSRTRP